MSNLYSQICPNLSSWYEIYKDDPNRIIHNSYIDQGQKLKYSEVSDNNSDEIIFDNFNRLLMDELGNKTIPKENPIPKVNNSLYCSFYCLSNPSCNLYDYNKEKQLCTLYRNGNISVGQTAKHKSHISGQRIPSNVLNNYNQQTQQEMTKLIHKEVILDENEINQCISSGKNRQYSGTLLEMKPNINSVKQCQTKCQEKTGCNYFSYVTNNYTRGDSINHNEIKPNNCYLFTNKGNVYVRDNIESGPKNCTEFLTKDLKYPTEGSTLIKGPNSPEGCQEKCEQNPNCTFFSWNPESNLCYLHDSSTTQPIEAPGWTSGPGNPNDNCLHPNQRIISRNKGSQKISEEHSNSSLQPNLDTCRKQCLEEPNCHYFNYYPHYKESSKEGLCEIIADKSVTFDNTTEIPVISGPKTCNALTNSKNSKSFYGGEVSTGDISKRNNKYPSPNYHIENISSNNEIINTVSADSAEDCHRQCVIDKDCHQYTYNTNSQQCHFHNHKPSGKQNIDKHNKFGMKFNYTPTFGHDINQRNKCNSNKHNEKGGDIRGPYWFAIEEDDRKFYLPNSSHLVTGYDANKPIRTKTWTDCFQTCQNFQDTVGIYWHSSKHKDTKKQNQCLCYKKGGPEPLNSKDNDWKKKDNLQLPSYKNSIPIEKQSFDTIHAYLCQTETTKTSDENQDNSRICKIYPNNSGNGFQPFADYDV